MSPRTNLARNRDHWNDLAVVDPLWAILSDPARQHGRWDPESFFETGRSEVDGVLAQIARHQRPVQFGRVLDFGCGVGRLSRALSHRFATVVGLDISREMIEQARAYHRDRTNCEFIVNTLPDLSPLPSDAFDFIYSNIALQHVAQRPAIRAYLEEFVRLLKPDGIAVFQLPSALRLRNRLQLRPRVYGLLRSMGASPRWLYERLGLHPVTMTFLREDDVRETLVAAGGRVLEVQSRRAGSTITALYFVAKDAGFRREVPAGAGHGAIDEK